MTPSWPVLWRTVEAGGALGGLGAGLADGRDELGDRDRVRGAQLADAYVHGRDAVAVDVRVAGVLAGGDLVLLALALGAEREGARGRRSVAGGVAGALVDLHVDLVRVDLDGRELLADGVGALVLVGAERAGADQHEAVGEPAELLRAGLVQVAVEADLEAGDDQGAEVGLV
jgi:hypothetical protein